MGQNPFSGWGEPHKDLSSMFLNSAPACGPDSQWMDFVNRRDGHKGTEPSCSLLRLLELLWLLAKFSSASHALAL